MALWEKADPAGTDSKCDHIMNGIRYIWKGLQSLRHRRLDVAVLDATGIAVSLLRQDMGTAGSVMFLLGIGELLEEWTHKKSVGDLARSMSLNVEKVWQKVGDQEILVSASTIEKGDEIIVHAGNIIPFDGRGNSRRCDRKSGFSDPENLYRLQKT